MGTMSGQITTDGMIGVCFMIAPFWTRTGNTHVWVKGPTPALAATTRRSGFAAWYPSYFEGYANSDF